MLTKPEPATREAANLSIEAKDLADAKALDVNVSRAAETGIIGAVRAEKNTRWLAEYHEALEYFNEWVAENGLPLDKYWQF
jgi:antitoxin CcdA